MIYNDNDTVFSFDDINISPANFIFLLFDRTDEDGILYVPSYDFDHEGDYRCKVDWNIKKCESLIKVFQKHYSMIQQIAPHWDEIDSQTEKAGEILNDELFAFWNTYLRPITVQNFDLELINDIIERNEYIDFVHELARGISHGKKITADEKALLFEFMDIEITQDEKDYYREYVNAVYQHAEERIGKRMCAYQVIQLSTNIARLINLHAPQIVVDHWLRNLMVHMLLYKYGLSKEPVSQSFRHTIERQEAMSQQELDDLYRPKRSNSRKSLAPLFIYFILKQYTDSVTHLHQKDIIARLEQYPYEITLERKALSRILHNLMDSQLYIRSDRTGVWIEQEPQADQPT